MNTVKDMRIVAEIVMQMKRKIHCSFYAQKDNHFRKSILARLFDIRALRGSIINKLVKLVRKIVIQILLNQSHKTIQTNKKLHFVIEELPALHKLLWTKIFKVQARLMMILIIIKMHWVGIDWRLVQKIGLKKKC